MERAEQVTFGGSGLNRSAHLREDATARAAALRHPRAAAVVLWRGKPLVAGDDADRLVLLPLDHPLLRGDLDDGPGGPVYLGQSEDDAPYFACDISKWRLADPDPAGLDTFLDTTRQAHPDLPAGQVFAELRGLMSRLDPRNGELVVTAKAIIGWHQTHRFCARCGGVSEPAQGGWQRRCPACDWRHFPRTDPVVIMLITQGNAVLMGRSPGWPDGMYSLLAGFVEPGETLEAAVRREVFEEAGVKVGAVSYLASQPWPYPSSLMIGCAGQALSREITIDPVEIEDALWVSREDMMTVFAGEHPVLKPARRGAIAHFLLQNWLADTLD